MKKRILAVLLIAILLLNIVPAPVYAAAEPIFTVETVTASAGEVVDVAISVKNNPGIASIKLNVEYNPSLTLNSVSYNTAIGGISQQPQKMSNPVILNWVNATANTNGDWVFATLSFTVAEDAPDGKYDIQLSYEPDNVYNIAEDNIFFEIENGAVMIGCNHDEKTEVPAKTADCVNSGNNRYYICNSCDAVLKSDGKTVTTVEAETVPFLGHAFGEWVVIIEPSDTEKGEERRDCANCDHFETRELNTTAEPAFTVETVMASAGEVVDVAISVKNNPGIASIKLNVEYDPSLTLNSVSYNTAIGGISQQPQKMSNPVILNWVNATANTNGDWVFATLTFTVAEDAPDGKYDIQLSYEPDNVYNIAENNIFFEIENGAVMIGCNHDEKTEVPAKTADCVNSGNNRYYICNSCDTVLKSDGKTVTTVEAETVPALGHAFGEWVVTIEPTCTEAGEKRRYCENCDAYETCESKATGHNYEEVVTDPTCTTQGYTTHTCSNCGDSYIDGYIDAPGHDFENGTCVNCGEPEKKYFPGDVDLDSDVDVDDVLALLWNVLFPEEYPIEAEADFDGTGTVDVDDVLALLWHVLFPDEYPLKN